LDLIRNGALRDLLPRSGVINNTSCQIILSAAGAAMLRGKAVPCSSRITPKAAVGAAALIF